MKRRSVLLSGVALSGTALANDSIFFSPLKYLGAEQQRSIDASRSLLDNLIPPSLPQYDNLAGKLARRAVLTSKKLVYVWTENFANVKGVPMARSVPLGELPNVDWLLKTAGVIVELIVNFVASLPASAAAQFERIAAGLSGDLEAARQVHEALLEEAKNDPAAAGSLLLRFTELQTRVIALLTRVGLLVDDILKSASNLVTQGGQGDGLNRFRAAFGTLRLPEVADSFRDDEAFAYWRVAGPNPLLIRRVDALPANFPLGEEQFRRVMGADDSLLEAAASRRLYLLDYAELASWRRRERWTNCSPGRASPMRRSPCSPLARIGRGCCRWPSSAARTPLPIRCSCVPRSRRVICTGVGRWPRRWSRSPRRTTTRCSSTWPRPTW